MSATARRALCADKLSESSTNSTGRFIDIRLDLEEWNGGQRGGETLLSVGGRFDRKLKKYVDDGQQARVLKLQPAQ